MSGVFDANLDATEALFRAREALLRTARIGLVILALSCSVRTALIAAMFARAGDGPAVEWRLLGVLVGLEVFRVVLGGSGFVLLRVLAARLTPANRAPLAPPLALLATFGPLVALVAGMCHLGAVGLLLSVPEAAGWLPLAAHGAWASVKLFRANALAAAEADG